MRLSTSFVVLLFALNFGCDSSDTSQTITLVTTTTIRDSGILDELLALYKIKSGLSVRAVAVGSGHAMEIARRGDADVILTHDPVGEQKFLAEGYGISRQEVMYNDYVLVGPPEDPAKVVQLRSSAEVFRQIMDRQTTFISRGDESGTHEREKATWSAAGLTPSGSWYIKSGQGMAAVLRMADEKRAYTLTDRGTYIAQQSKLMLAIVFAGDPNWLNRYAVIVVNPEKHSHVKHQLAKQFADFIVSPDCQQLIKDYGRVKFGEPLFRPGSPQAGGSRD